MVCWSTLIVSVVDWVGQSTVVVCLGGGTVGSAWLSQDVCGTMGKIVGLMHFGPDSISRGSHLWMNLLIIQCSSFVSFCIACCRVGQWISYHYMQSTYGDSTQFQGWAQWSAPLARIGQVGARPYIWAAVSSPLFQILTAEGLLKLFALSHAIYGHLLDLASLMM